MFFLFKMELFSILLLVFLALGIIFLVERILAHPLKLVFYLLLVFLALVYLFDLSLTEIFDFLKNLVFLAF